MFRTIETLQTDLGASFMPLLLLIEKCPEQLPFGEAAD
jgi:hypothetical protein